MEMFTNSVQGVDTVAASEAQKRATEKWQKEKVEDIRLRVPKGKKLSIQDHATKTGESINSFINRAIDETIARDNANLDPDNM